MAAPGVGGIASIVCGPDALRSESGARDCRRVARDRAAAWRSRWPRRRRVFGWWNRRSARCFRQLASAPSWRGCRPHETAYPTTPCCPRPVAVRAEDDRWRGVRGVPARPAIRRANRARVSAARGRNAAGDTWRDRARETARRWPASDRRSSLASSSRTKWATRWGCRTGASGVMKARPSVDDVIALRMSTLAFRQKEAAVMRAGAHRPLGGAPGTGAMTTGDATSRAAELRDAARTRRRRKTSPRRGPSRCYAGRPDRPTCTTRGRKSSASRRAIRAGPDALRGRITLRDTVDTAGLRDGSDQTG